MAMALPVSSKKLRHDTICRILENETISSQEQLIERLAEEGVEVKQGTLSRDFKDLMIAKTPDAFGKYVYKLPKGTIAPIKTDNKGTMATFTRQGLLNIEFSGQLAVIRTPRGYAKGIAHDIDMNNIAGIIGTIGGEDTVLIILREGTNKDRIAEALEYLFPKQ